MSTYGSAQAARMGQARKALKAAQVAVSNAQTLALAAAQTPQRTEAINHAVEHAMAALCGMDKALRAEWME